ncbi:Uncharacterized protein Fot_41559 [Forsythia ovata]|uniref:Uncharacterized protein n=1 Tax=Forsythia ovata TaxID=205694 RepID=A0ABD1RIL9_9LAMI
MIVWGLTLVKADNSQQLKFIIVDCCKIRCKENSEYTDRELGETAVSLDPQITVQKLLVPWRNTNSGSRRKWWYQCAKFGANGGIYSEKEGLQRGSPTARVTGGANGGIFSAKEGPPRGDPQRERAVHSEEAPQRECEN